MVDDSVETAAELVQSASCRALIVVPRPPPPVAKVAAAPAAIQRTADVKPIDDGEVAPATFVVSTVPVKTISSRVAVEKSSFVPVAAGLVPAQASFVPAAVVVSAVVTPDVSSTTVVKAVVLAIAVSLAASKVNATAAPVLLASSVVEPASVVAATTASVGVPSLTAELQPTAPVVAAIRGPSDVVDVASAVSVAPAVPVDGTPSGVEVVSVTSVSSAVQVKTSTAPGAVEESASEPVSAVAVPTEPAAVAAAAIVPAAAESVHGFPAPVPKYVAFVNTGDLQQTRQLSIDDYTSLLSEGMSIPGRMVMSVHVKGPDFANVVYSSMEDLEAVVKAFAGGPPADGPLAGVEMKVSAPAPGPYPTPAQPAGPKLVVVQAHTKRLLQCGKMSLSNYMSLFKEGMSIPGHAVNFVLVRIPDLAHVMYSSKEDAQAVVDTFADGPPVGGPLDGVEMWLEMKTKHRGRRGRGGRRGERSAAAA